MQLHDRAGLLATASSVLDTASVEFVERLGAPSAVAKGVDDFATAVDLELERSVATSLTGQTGIPVHGEEFGGPDLGSGRVWVLDPIDGTFNYSSGIPLCGILLALLEDGEPVIGLTWLPLLGKRLGATVDGPVLDNGAPLPALRSGTLADAMISFGSIDHGQTRIELLRKLSGRSSRVRMLGSTGVDLGFTAAGILGGAVVFSYHAWDNAAGVALVRAAGGVVTDLAGLPWTIESDSVLAAAPGVHGELLELVAQTIDEGDKS